MEKVSAIVIQRQTLDWEHMTAAAFKPLSAGFCRIWGKPEDYVYRLMELWDSTFTLGYFETRFRLKLLALANLHATRDICFVPYEGYNNIPVANGYYLFIDDDDWVSPDLGHVLSTFLPEDHDALLWRSVNVGSPQQEHPVFVWGMNGRCMTNNYAVSSHWLSGTQKINEVIQHARAAQTLAGMHNVRQIDAALTASNKSPCSSVSLDRGLQGQLEPGLLLQMVDEYLGKMAELKDEHIWMVPWIKPLVNDVVDLFVEVRKSRI